MLTYQSEPANFVRLNLYTNIDQPRIFGMDMTCDLVLPRKSVIYDSHIQGDEYICWYAGVPLLPVHQLCQNTANYKSNHSNRVCSINNRQCSDLPRELLRGKSFYASWRIS